MQLGHRLGSFGAAARRLDWRQAGLLAAGTLLALLVRLSLLSFKSVDYEVYTKVWYESIQSLGYLALRGDFSNYTPPYIYVLYLVVRFLPFMSKVAAIKVPSILADIACAAFVYRIIAARAGNRLAPLLGYMAALLAPVVILNSSLWGQADSIYTAALLACVYFLLVKRHWAAFIAFGLAFAFKLQAIFLLPLLAILWLRGLVSWKHFLAIPAMYLLGILPAWIIGRPLGDLLTIYATQADYYNRLSMHAPSLYAWFPNDPDLARLLYPAGLALAAAVLLLLVLVASRSRAPLTPALLVNLAAFGALLAPFVLPRMHQRYFYPADLLSIPLGFFYPACYYIPLVLNMVSFFSYQYFLFGPENVPMPVLAIVTLALIAIQGRMLWRELYPGGAQREAAPELPQVPGEH